MKKEQAIKECETLKRCLMQYSDEPNNIKSGQAIETVLSMLKEKDKDKEIEKKDKIIDRTAITIIQRDIGKGYCEFNKSCEKCENGSRDLKCKECIRQYFEREVDSSEQN